MHDQETKCFDFGEQNKLQRGIFLWQGTLYYCTLCHFGAKFSAYWWQRLGALQLTLAFGSRLRGRMLFEGRFFGERLFKGRVWRDAVGSREGGSVEGAPLWQAVLKV